MAIHPDAPYRQSRAALRQLYGTRSIDASAPQSSRDFTPSGRIRYREQQYGIGEADATQASAQDFRNFFAPAVPPMANPLPMGAASAFPAMTPSAQLNGVTNPFGQLSPPTITPLSYNLNEPSSLTADELAPYAPPATATAYTPAWKKKPVQGLMGSILEGPSRWLA